METSLPAASLTIKYNSDEESVTQEPVAKRKKVDHKGEGEEIHINRGAEALDNICIIICEGEILPNGYVSSVFLLQNVCSYLVF